jgi:hypothetical protein
MKKRYDDNTPVSEQYPVSDLRYSVTPFSVATQKIVVASNDATIAYKPKRDTNKPRKAESVPFIPVTRKPPKKVIAKSTNIKAMWTNGNEASYNGKITPLDAGMNVHTCLAENERDTCPSHKQKKVR